MADLQKEWDAAMPIKEDLQSAWESAQPIKQRDSSLDIPGEPSVGPPSQAEAAIGRNIVKPVVEGTAMGVGALLGGPAGAGLGYGIVKAGERLYQINPQGTMLKEIKQSALDVGTGSAIEMGGQVIGKGLQRGMELAGKVIKPAFGRLTGVGPGAIEEALISGKDTGFSNVGSDFNKALRGKITGEEIVDNAKSALEALKDQRRTIYREQLLEVTKNKPPLDTTNIENKLTNLLESYNLTINDKGRVIPKGIGKLYKQEMRNINEIVSDVQKITENPELRTVEQLDLFKQKLDNFYSPNKDSRALVTGLRNEVKDTLTKNVPGYEEMTKGYAEATNLIKDIESNLMLRKSGMSGRITADNTLRRLTSSMRDNFEMRKELVDILGSKGDQELAGQIAGYSMNAVLPRGLSGSVPSIAGMGALIKYFNPKLWPILAASSPRVSGEFLQAYGMALGELSGSTGAVGRTVSLEAGKRFNK